MEYEKCVLTAFKEVNDAIINYDNAHRSAGLQRSFFEATDKYLELARLRYINGDIMYLDLLDAQRQYFDAEVNYSNAILNEYLAFVELYKALGGGWNYEPVKFEEQKKQDRQDVQDDGQDK